VTFPVAAFSFKPENIWSQKAQKAQEQAQVFYNKKNVITELD
jgi:hypothetical protein